LLEEPLVVNDTVIVQAGQYSTHVGRLDLKLTTDCVPPCGGPKLEVTSYESLPIDDSVPGDPAIAAKIDGYAKQAEDMFLKPLDLGLLDTVAETEFDIVPTPLQESNMGDLVTDAYREAVTLADAPEAPPIVIEANGVLRDAIAAGKTGAVSVADAIAAVPLGFGLDGQPGYPLLAFYVTAQELKAGLEVTTSVVPLEGDSYFLQVAGLKFAWDPEGLFFDRVKEIYLLDETGEYSPEPLDVSEGNTALYKIVVNFYLGAMMAILGDLTYGNIVITPKDEAGNPVTDLTTRLVDADPAATGVQELKCWSALLQYLKALPDNDGNFIPEVPEQYSAPQGRITTVE
jgi:2',3'-cyclic-nucleotide 2'-phosphodiesterase (5'-nucleotidase family)